MKLESFGNGSVVFHKGRPAVPESRRITGTGNTKVEIIEGGDPGTPNHFEVTHFISFSEDRDGLVTHNRIHICNLIAWASGNVSYPEIEDAGARELPRVLRDLADAIEKDIARAQAERAEIKDG